MQKYYATKESPNGEYVTTNHVRHSVESVDPVRVHIPAGRENDMTLYDTLEDFLSTEGLEHADDHTFPILPATDDEKTVKIQEIKQARDDEYTSVLVTSDGLHFKADLETIIDVKTMIETLPDGASYTGYKNADGSYNDVTKAQFQTAITEGGARKAAAFGKERALVDLIVNASTKAELDGINW